MYPHQHYIPTSNPTILTSMKITLSVSAATQPQILLSIFLFLCLEKYREMRANQQSRDLNLAIVLISSVLMFLCCHTPRSVILHQFRPHQSTSLSLGSLPASTRQPTSTQCYTVWTRRKTKLHCGSCT